MPERRERVEIRIMVLRQMVPPFCSLLIPMRPTYGIYDRSLPFSTPQVLFLCHLLLLWHKRRGSFVGSLIGMDWHRLHFLQHKKKMKIHIFRHVSCDVIQYHLFPPFQSAICIGYFGIVNRDSSTNGSKYFYYVSNSDTLISQPR